MNKKNMYIIIGLVALLVVAGYYTTTLEFLGGTIQNFDEYEQSTDSNNYVTVFPHEVKVTDLPRNSYEYVMKDYGDGYFTDFIHYFEVTVDAQTNHGLVDLWSIGNNPDSTDHEKAKDNVDGLVAYLFCYDGGGYTEERWITFKEFDGLDVDDIDGDGDVTEPKPGNEGSIWWRNEAGTLLDFGDTFYVTITRQGSQATMRIYKDHERTDEMGNGVTLTGVGTPYRYMKTMMSRGVTYTSPGLITSTMANLQFYTPGNTYELVTSYTGQGSISPSGGTYADGEVVTVTATPAPGWSFSRWSGDITSYEPVIQVPMNSGMVIHATFTEDDVYYNLNIGTHTNGQIILNPPGGNYLSGSEVTLTAIGNTGYHFTGWTGDLVGVAVSPCTIVMDRTKNIGATFATNPTNEYTLTINTVGNGHVTKNPSKLTYQNGEFVTISAMPENPLYWKFSGWAGDYTGVVTPTVITMNENKIITATFTEKDTDGDGIMDSIDNCPAIKNPDQLDTDGNGYGDVCDGSGVPGFELVFVMIGLLSMVFIIKRRKSK